MTAPLAAVIAVNNFGDNESGGLAGPLALLVVVLLGIGTVLLIRNMNRHLRRLPASFDDPAAAPGAAPPAAAGGGRAAEGRTGGGRAAEGRTGGGRTGERRTGDVADGRDGGTGHTER